MAKNTSTGLEENLASALSYVVGPVTGIIFLVAEKENKNVRFHAMQSTVGLGILFVLRVVLGFISSILPFIDWIFGIINSLLGIAIFISIVYLAYTAYQGKMFRIPIIGDIAWNQINR